jgi:hypothetical protein
MSIFAWVKLGVAFVIVTAVATLLFHVKTLVDQHYERMWAPKVAQAIEERKKVEQEFADYRLAEQAEVSRIQTGWNAADARVNQLETELQQQRMAAFAPVERAASHLPAPVARIRIPADAVRVLDDAAAATAVAAAAAEPARAPAAPAAGADHQGDRVERPGAGDDTTLGLLTHWAVDSATMYLACEQRVVDLIAWYDAIRAPTLTDAVH